MKLLSGKDHLIPQTSKLGMGEVQASTGPFQFVSEQLSFPEDTHSERIPFIEMNVTSEINFKYVITYFVPKSKTQGDF